MATIKKCDICTNETEEDFAASLAIKVMKAEEGHDNAQEVATIIAGADICKVCDAKIVEKKLMDDETVRKNLQRFLTAQIGDFFNRLVTDKPIPRSAMPIPAKQSPVAIQVSAEPVSNIPKEVLDEQRKAGKVVMSSKKSKFIECRCNKNPTCKYCGGSGQRLMPPNYKPPTSGMAAV